MTSVVTVSGEVDASKLGLVSMHEHVFLDGSFLHREYMASASGPVVARPHVDDPLGLENLGSARRDLYAVVDDLKLDDEVAMTGEIAEFAAAGGGTILEVSTLGIRVQTPALRRVSEATGVHLIASTGLYAEPGWPDKMKRASLDEYVEFMRKELLEGIDDTGIRAGHIKVAVRDITRQQELVLRAAARVSAETGASVTIHPGFKFGSNQRTLLTMMMREGMDPARLIMAHASAFFTPSCGDLRARILYPDATWRLTLESSLELLDLGVTLSVDCFGHQWEVEPARVHNEEDYERLAGLVELVRRNYEQQLVLGCDVFRKSLTRRHGGDGYRRLPAVIVPLLADLGVSDYAIRCMTVDNPARLLAW
jgi:phosphotriesterase-related protein